MGKRYSQDVADASRACKARGDNLRIKYKNTREVAAAIRGKNLKKAQKYLKHVLAHKDAIPYTRHCGNIGRHAQGHKFKINSGGQCRWPEKPVRHILDLLQNAESNAELQALDVDQLYIKHIQVNRAPKMRRRTYRAHGRIGPYMASPCHVELILALRDDQVAKGDDEVDMGVSSTTDRLESGATA